MLFKKCIAPYCNRIVWFSKDGICKRCEREATAVLTRIGKSRNSGNKSTFSNHEVDTHKINELQQFALLSSLDDTPKQANELTDCHKHHYDSTPSYSNNDSSSYGSCSGDSGSSSGSSSGGSDY